MRDPGALKPWLVRSQPEQVEDLLKRAAQRDDEISFAAGPLADDLAEALLSSRP